MDQPDLLLPLVPWPASLERRDGGYRQRAEARVVVDASVAGDADTVARRFAAARGLPVARGPSRTGDIVWRARDSGGASHSVSGDHVDESYRLEASDDGIVVLAATAEGFARATATLEQLGPEAPGLVIEDRPRFPWRGLLLDCSRHFVPTPQVLRILDHLAAHKMNRFHWHLTDDQGWRLAIEALPRLQEVAAWRERDGTRHGGCYGPDDVQAVVDRAAELGITVMPEIELPGHSSAALAAYPELSCTGGPFEVETEWGIFEEVYCAGEDASLRFLETVFEQVLRQFPGAFVHVGGDECPKTRWKECARCQARIREEGLRDEDHLQTWFVDHFGRFLARRDRRFVGWDEILEGGLPEGAIVQSWRGVDGAIAAARAGHDSVVSPMSHCYLDFNLAHLDLRRAYDFDPVPLELEEHHVHHVLGGECNLWTERAPPEKLDERMFPRMLATAERLWTGPGLEYEHFVRRLDELQPRLEKDGVEFGERDDPGHDPEDRFDWSLPVP